jgi:hypothetical protein
MGLPWRFAIGCIDGEAAPDGQQWILRADVVWSKPNGLPESVTDRVRRSHEQWFHFTKEPRYFAAIDELREPHQLQSLARSQRNRFASDMSQVGVGPPNTLNPAQACNPLGKLPGSVWEIATEPLTIPDHLGIEHFAAFPTEWPRRIILGWSPSGICVECGEGRQPVVEKDHHGKDRSGPQARRVVGYEAVNRSDWREGQTAAIIGYACACTEPTASTRPAVVLDPFGGTGTTAMVAKALGRHGISLDLSHDYCRIADWRTGDPDQIRKVQSKTYGIRREGPKVSSGQDALFSWMS